MSEGPALKSHRIAASDTTIVEVGPVRFGDGSCPVIAGPCAVEDRQQIKEAARIVAEGGASMLRGGAFKPRTSPYSFQGLGEHGLRLLEEAGREHRLPTVTEAMEPAHAELVARHADMLQVGARNMQNFPLLQAVGRIRKPVLLKRGPSATIDEWLLAAEYVLNEGNDQIVLCERGIRTFEPRTRNTLDISAVPVLKGLSHLPVIVDPSHASGCRELIVPLALAARAAGADGMMVEVHPQPSAALSDGMQQLDRAEFLELMEALGVGSLRDDIDRIDRELVRLLSRRLERSLRIGRVKADRGLPVRAQDREQNVLEGVRSQARQHGLDPGLAERLFELILEHSRAAQHSLNGPPRRVAVG